MTGSFELVLTPEDERLLAALAEADGVSRHEATLRAIRDAAARHAHETKVAQPSALVAPALFCTDTRPTPIWNVNLDAPDDPAYELVMSVARRELSIDEVAAALARWH